jgi:signal transduction histidine kinase
MKNINRSSQRITTMVLFFPVVVLLLYGVLMYLYFTYAQVRNIRWELSQYQDRLMDTEASNLKEKVHSLAQYVRYYDSQSGTRIKKDVQTIVKAAVNVADGIYDAYVNTKDRDELKEMIIHALEKIHFEGRLGYLFMLDMKGNVLMHIDHSRIGKNDMNLRDSNGKEIVKEFTRIASQKGEGFVKYYWYLPNSKDGAMLPKISFIKKIKGLDWYIGAGEYVYYMRRFIRNDMLGYIKNNGESEDWYFFVTDSHGETIYHPRGDATKEATKYLIEGVYQDDKNLAYSEYIAQYDWYVTAVKNLDKVNISIKNKKNYLMEKRTQNIHVTLWIMLAMLLVSLLLSLYLSSIINRRLRNYDEQLKESNEHLLFQSRQALIGELLPMIAHQWRQPINRIASIVALMRFGFPEGKCDIVKVDEECAKIEENIEFMSETIDDFRTFYKPKTDIEMVELSEIVNKAIEFVDGAVKHKDIHLTVNLEKIHYRLYANEYLQVLINIIKNAVDASSQHRDVDVSLFHQDDIVYAVIKDNGDGMSKDELEKIFEPYYSTKENSMGLGLYMSKMIIEKHMQGNINVESAPGEGTRFEICLYSQESLDPPS